MKPFQSKFQVYITIILQTMTVSSAFSNDASWNQRQLAALNTGELSIQKLEKFLSTHPGDHREAEFLNRLADLYLEQSGISFDYTEGDSLRTGKNRYRASLKKSIEVMTRIMRQHPQHPSVPDLLYKQGKAFKELGQAESAKSNFLRLISSDPNHFKCDSALMELAKYAQDENKHELALKYLESVIVMEHSSYRSIAYHHSAWSRFNLGQFQVALEDLEKEISLYGKNPSDTAFLDVSAQDYALFYFEAIHRKAAFSSVQDALKRFNSVTHEPQSSAMILRFSKLLKAYRYHGELEFILEHLGDDQGRESLKQNLALLLLDLKFEQHEFADLGKILKHLKHDSSSEKSVYKLLADLHQQVIKNQKSTQLDRLLNPMKELTSYLGAKTAIYSTAETAFQIGRYSIASEYYQQLLDQKDNSVKIRLISSLYQELLQARISEKPFKTVKLDDPQEPISEKDRETLLRWVKIQHELNSMAGKEEIRFYLESLKFQYRYLDRTSAMKRLLELSVSKTVSNENEIAASILMDTLNASGKQDELANHCENTFWEKYHSIETPCLLIRAKKLVIHEKFDQADRLLKRIKTGSTEKSTLKMVSLLNSTIHLKQGKIAEYIQDLESMLGQGQDLEPESAKEILLYHWFHRNKNKITHYLQLHGFCEKISGQLCDQYEASLVLMEKNPKSSYLNRFKMSTKGAKSSQALWALSALEESTKIPFQDRIVLVQRISNHWDQVDPFLQVQFIPVLKSRVNDALEGIRTLTPKIAPIRADESTIERRIQLVLELDQTFAKAAKLNWMSVRVKTIHELAKVYEDLNSELKKIGTPEKYTTPFQKKKEELLGAVNRLQEENQSMTALENDLTHSFDRSHLLIPENYRSEWINAVKNHQADYLQYLISLRKNDEDSTYLRGLVLCTQLKDSANAEGLELIRSSGRKN